MVWTVRYWKRCEEWEEKVNPSVVTDEGIEIRMPMFVDHPGRYDEEADKLAQLICDAVNEKQRREE